MVRSFLLLFFVLAVGFSAFAKPKISRATSQSHATIETLASWKIKAPDDQNFSLHEDKYENDITKALTFSLGDKDQRTFPVDKAKWDKWRTRLVRLMASLRESQRCAHPLKFEISKKGESLKTKNICLDEITESERIEIQNLVSEWNEYLYRKE